MTPIGICVHNTANDASAKNESNYIVNNPASKDTSYHFAVDDKEAYQNLPLDRNGWHAGDGQTGAGNRKHIGIEICYSKSGGEKFTKAEQNAAQLIAQLLKTRNWGVEKVKKHQDFSGKYCPHRTLDLGWDRFINMVKKELEGGMPGDDYGTIVGKSTQRDEVVSHYKFEIGTAVPNELLVKVQALVTQAEKKGYDRGYEAGKKDGAGTTPTPAPTTPFPEEDFEVNGGQTKEVINGVEVTKNFTRKG
jgi:N-acetylmuramoyl-L-alanine amidase CwlA